MQIDRNCDVDGDGERTISDNVMLREREIGGL